MPVYEFLCPSCRIVFNFHSSRVDTDTVPVCPKCKSSDMQRQISSFSTLPRGEEVQEEKILGAFDKLLDKAEGKGDITGENLAQDLIQFGEDSGCTFSDQVNEALGQIREGADPIEVEKKLAGLLDEDGCSFDSGTVKIVKGGKKVEVDETLYDLHTNMK